MALIVMRRWDIAISKRGHTVSREAPWSVAGMIEDTRLEYREAGSRGRGDAGCMPGRQLMN
jgi:hypothetical protein